LGRLFGRNPGIGDQIQHHGHPASEGHEHDQNYDKTETFHRFIGREAWMPESPVAFRRDKDNPGVIG
jgi:hypothetical protein